MARGGARPGAGRKPGKPNKTTVERQKAFEDLSSKIASVIDDAFKGDAHEFLMAVYKNPEMPLPVRVDAAKAAVGYEKPKLQSVQHSGDADNPVETVTRIELSSPEIDHSPNRTAAQAAPHIYGTS